VAINLNGGRCLGYEVHKISKMDLGFRTKGESAKKALELGNQNGNV